MVYARDMPFHFHFQSREITLNNRCFGTYVVRLKLYTFDNVNDDPPEYENNNNNYNKIIFCLAPTETHRNSILGITHAAQRIEIGIYMFSICEQRGRCEIIVIEIFTNK